MLLSRSESRVYPMAADCSAVVKVGLAGAEPLVVVVLVSVVAGGAVGQLRVDDTDNGAMGEVTECSLWVVSPAPGEVGRAGRRCRSTGLYRSCGLARVG
jgi:hypothetical protein